MTLKVKKQLPGKSQPTLVFHTAKIAKACFSQVSQNSHSHWFWELSDWTSTFLMVVAIKFIDLSHTSLDSEQYHLHPVDGQYPAPCGYRIYFYTHRISYIIYDIYIYILHDKFDMSWYEYPTTSHVTGEAALFHRWCGFALPMWHCFWSFLLQSWVFKVPFGKQPSSFLKVADLFLKGTWGNPALNITGWIAPQELQICSHWNLCVVGKKAK